MNFFLKLNKNISALFLTTFFSLSIFIYNDSSYVKNIESYCLNIISFFSKPQLQYQDLLSAKKENEVLKKNIVILELEKSNLINYAIENETLKQAHIFVDTTSLLFRKKIDSLDNPYPLNQITFIPAYVVNNNYVTSPNSIIINAGKNKNIDINQPVIDFSGNLIGKIINTANNNSKVQILTDNNFSVTVKINDDNSFAQFKPTDGRFGVLDGVLKSANVKKGDIIYTSGVSDIYPHNIPVCEVIKAEVNKNNLFQNVIVKIISDIENLNYVFVIQ